MPFLLMSKLKENTDFLGFGVLDFHGMADLTYEKNLHSIM
jgi:hypothetical protein